MRNRCAIGNERGGSYFDLGEQEHVVGGPNVYALQGGHLVRRSTNTFGLSSFDRENNWRFLPYNPFYLGEEGHIVGGPVAALQGGRLIRVSSAVVQKTLSAKPLSTGEG